MGTDRDAAIAAMHSVCDKHDVYSLSPRASDEAIHDAGLLIVSRERLARVLRHVTAKRMAERSDMLSAIKKRHEAQGMLTRAERERDAARDELAAARVVLSEAVGHEDEPHETLAEVAALLVLDCDSEHSRACTAERELAELERELAKLRKEHSDECPQSNTRGEGSSP